MRLTPTRPRHAEASVLVALLWILAFLGFVVVGTLHQSSLELRVAKNHADRIQARYLALAGVEKAKAVLYHDLKRRRGEGIHHDGSVLDRPSDFQDQKLGRGQYSVVYQDPETGTLRYGPTDVSAKLDINQASEQELATLLQADAATMAAILDFRDPDGTLRNGGAEYDYYAALNPPYVIRDAPFRSLLDLLLVRDVSPSLLLGEDANANGLLDPEEDDGEDWQPMDNADGFLDRGWSAHLSLDAHAPNVSARGEARIQVKQAGENELTTVPGMSQEIAQAIVRWRGDNEINTLADLLKVTDQSGNTVITTSLLVEMADQLTTLQETELPGRVNLNTASAKVLGCLPGMTPELAQAIVAHRSSSGFFKNEAALLEVPAMTSEIFAGLVSRITVEGDTWRILSEGEIPSSGARFREEWVVRVSDSTVQTIWRREGF